MTQNQVAFYNARQNAAHNAAMVSIEQSKLDETVRSNQARETETNRANLAKEGEIYRTDLARELETARANMATERIRESELAEKKRASQMSEFISLQNLQQQGRLESAKIQVSQEANRINELRANQTYATEQQKNAINKDRLAFDKSNADVQNALTSSKISNDYNVGMMNASTNQLVGQSNYQKNMAEANYISTKYSTDWAKIAVGMLSGVLGFAGKAM